MDSAQNLFKKIKTKKINKLIKHFVKYTEDKNSGYKKATYGQLYLLSRSFRPINNSPYNNNNK